MGYEKKIRLAFFFTLMGIVSAAIVYNDIIYIQNRSLFAAVESLRILLLLIVAMAILVYFNEKCALHFDFYAKLCLITIYAFDIAIAFTRPRDAVGGQFFSIGLLLLGYFLPMKSLRFRNFVALIYSVGLASVLLFVKTSYLPTEIIILAMIAGINAIGISASKVKLSPAGNVETLDKGASPTQSVSQDPHQTLSTNGIATLSNNEPEGDYLRHLEARIQALPLSKREKEVALHILQGESRSEIASELNLSEETIKKHTANIYTKLEISSHSELFKVIMN